MPLLKGISPLFPELSTEEAQEDDERSEFIDSVEDVDDFVLTAVALTTTQVITHTHTHAPHL